MRGFHASGICENFWAILTFSMRAPGRLDIESTAHVRRRRGSPFARFRLEGRGRRENPQRKGRPERPQRTQKQFQFYTDGVADSLSKPGKVLPPFVISKGWGSHRCFEVH